MTSDTGTEAHVDVVARRDSGPPTRRWSSGPTRGFWLWFALLAGIVLWLAHLTALAALAGPSCTHPAAEWSMHGLTVGLAAATALAGWMCLRMVSGRSDADAADGGLDGRLRFLGLFGLLTQVISILLIVWEGTYVPFIDACH